MEAAFQQADHPLWLDHHMHSELQCAPKAYMIKSMHDAHLLDLYPTWILAL
jgi:hypothetical protein